jgi:hypothetical protein
MSDEQEQESRTITVKPMQITEELKALGFAENAEAAQLIPAFTNFNDVLQFCTWISQSDIVPQAYKGKPADIFVAMSYGKEIGLPFMTSVQKIAIIGGRPALPSDIKLAMVRARGLLEEFEETGIDEIEQTGKSKCMMKRKGSKNPMTHTFSVDLAKQAGLWERRGYNNRPTPWVSYKWRMLQLKPRDMVLRDLFGDVFFGMPSVEEAQEIELTESLATPEQQLAEQSQPETKGAAIRDTPAPPLSSGTLTMKAPEPETENLYKSEQSSASESPGKNPSTIAQLVDASCEQLRRLPGGGARLMKLWQQYRLAPAQFGKTAASALLPEPDLALFGNAVQKEIGESQKAGK